MPTLDKVKFGKRGEVITLSFYTAEDFMPRFVPMKCKRPRRKKVRGWKNRHRTTVKISDITQEGFRLRTFNRDWWVAFNEFPIFGDATHRELQDVALYPCRYDDPSQCDDHGDHLRWESLDICLGSNTFEYPKRFPFFSPFVRHQPRCDLFGIGELTAEEWANLVIKRVFADDAEAGTELTQKELSGAFNASPKGEQT